MKKVYSVLVDGVFFIAGVIIYSIAINMFIEPAEILAGGVTGISSAITHYINIGTGTMLLILNIPIIYLGYKSMGWRLIIKTAIVTPLLSVAIDVTKLFIKPYTGDRMLSSLAGGVLLGAGIGLIMLRGATTGGDEIIAKIVNEKFPSFTVGRIILLSDIVVVSLSAVVYKNLTSLLYSVLSMYAASKMTDLLLYGGAGGKAVYAVTDKGNEICKGIIDTLQRSATKIKVIGGYTGADKDMVFCVCRRDEINRVLNVIRTEDADAFITVCDAGDILGEGFNG